MLMPYLLGPSKLLHANYNPTLKSPNEKKDGVVYIGVGLVSSFVDIIVISIMRASHFLIPKGWNRAWIFKDNFFPNTHWGLYTTNIYVKLD